MRLNLFAYPLTFSAINEQVNCVSLYMIAAYDVDNYRKDLLHAAAEIQNKLTETQHDNSEFIIVNFTIALLNKMQIKKCLNELDKEYKNALNDIL